MQDMHDADKLFLKETIETWQPYYEQPLSNEDAREIVANLTGFFDLLDKWDRENEKIQKDI